jgi:hypothetical protein
VLSFTGDKATDFAVVPENVLPGDNPN